MTPPHHVIVDGSNLATEGRSLPSLAQLDEAVRAYCEEDPDANIIVVVDATFEHRIDESEKSTYDLAIEHGELLTPPAGAVGRGDAFILKIALRANATVLSNDSFQEFHGEHPWLFEEGRLVGGKPVPGVGWIFTARTPVRGMKSRQATAKARTSKAKAPIEAPKLKVGLPDGSRPKVGDVLVAPEVLAPVEAPAPVAKKATKRVAKKAAAAAVEEPASAPKGAAPVNDALSFVNFIASHPLGAEVVGTVSKFTSHGAMVEVDLGGGVVLECYAPVKRLGNPPPAKARDLLVKGEQYRFSLAKLDPARRVAELALP